MTDEVQIHAFKSQFKENSPALLIRESGVLKYSHFEPEIPIVLIYT